MTIAELLALCWYLLHGLLAAAAEARGAEVALGRVRGLAPSATLLLLLLEPALVLGVAVPLGAVLAAALERALVPVALGPTVDVGIGWTSWAAAAAAAAGGLFAAAAASAAVFRRPVLEQWRRAVRSTSGRGPVVEVVVVMAAVAGVAQLTLSGALGPGSGSGIAVLAPMLLIVAGAVVASRAAVLLARLGLGATRGTGAIGFSVGLRQVVRRPSARRTIGVLVVATALAVYGVSSAIVLSDNRDQRALTDVGAVTVLHVVRDPGTAARIRRVDPDGRSVAAVSEAPLRLSEPSAVFDQPSPAVAPSMLVVDPQTFAAVASWRRDFGAPSLRAVTRDLRRPAPTSPVVTGPGSALDVEAGAVPRSLDLAVELTDRSGTSVTAPLGTLTEGRRTYRAPTPGCASGCRLRRVYVARPPDQLGPFVAAFTVHGVRGGGSTGTTPQPSVGAVRWTPLNPTPDAQIEPAETVRTAPDGLHVTVAVSGSPGTGVPGFGAVAGAAPRVPALVADGLTSGDAEVTARTEDGTSFGVRPAGRISVVPRLGDAGVVVPRDWLAAAAVDGSPEVLPDQLWLAPTAPEDTIDRLRAAGVRVRSTERADRLSARFAAEGPAFASGLVVTCGVAAVPLAAVDVIVGLVLLARRRVFELSVMRSLGLRRRSMVGAVLVEQVAVIVPATIGGLVLGVASVQLALPALPAYVDDPRYPPFLVDQPLVLLAAVAASIAVVLLVAAALAAAAMVRSASVSRLREAEQ